MAKDDNGIKIDETLRNLSLLTDAIDTTEKHMKSLTDVFNESEKKAGKIFKSTLKGMIDDYGSSGLDTLINGTISMTTTYVSSAYGAEAGTITSNALSSGAMGAALGSSIAPVIGTAIGALGGALFGYIQGKVQIFEGKDEAFKSYYSGLYNSVLQAQSQSLTNGTAVAAKRETNQLPFSTLLGGDNKANNFLDSLTDFANNTPYDYDEVVSISKSLLSNGYKQEDVLSLLEKVGDAGSAIGMSKDIVADIAVSLGQLQTADKATMENLEPLLERGVNVWTYMAEASHKSKDEIIKMVNDGLIPGEKAANDIANALETQYSGSMDKQSQTYSGLNDTLKEKQDDLDSAMGEGYIETRKDGLNDQIDWLSGESGEKMKEAYNQVGQWKASLENLAEQYNRDAVDSVTSGTIAESYKESSQRGALEELAKEYKAAKQDYDNYVKLGDKEGEKNSNAAMGRIFAETQAIATNEFNGSDDAQIALMNNQILANNIKNDSKGRDAYWDAGYVMGQQFTEGLASKMNEGTSDLFNLLNPRFTNSSNNSNSNKGIYNSNGINSSNGISINNSSVKPVYWNMKIPTGEVNKNATIIGNGKAYGLSYVPYNNYPALLHEGERVLTASENRSLKTTNPITITGNNFNIRKESDITKTAQEIAKLINQAYALAP